MITVPNLRARVPSDAIIRVKFAIDYTFFWMIGPLHAYEALMQQGREVRQDSPIYRQNPGFGKDALETREWLLVEGTSPHDLVDSRNATD